MRGIPLAEKESDAPAVRALGLSSSWLAAAGRSARRVSAPPPPDGTWRGPRLSPRVRVARINRAVPSGVAGRGQYFFYIFNNFVN